MRVLRLLLCVRPFAAALLLAVPVLAAELLRPVVAPLVDSSPDTLAAAAAPVPAPGSPYGADSALIRRIEALVPVLMEGAPVAGLQVALVEEGEVAWTRGFGVADASSGRPVTEATIFEAASLSKPVFAWAVLRLVDEGRLDLDTPLSSLLEEPYIADDARLGAITARRVLTHTPGLPNWRRPRDGPLSILWEPGTRWSYSGEGFVYLQRVVEAVTGRGLDEVARGLVFEPLGMDASAYVWRQAFDSLKAAGHDADARSRGVSRRDGANAAASLHTTARDYARFLAAVLRGEGLRPGTRDAMLGPLVPVDSTCAVCAAREESGPRSDVLWWGLGWGIEMRPSGDLIWHWGDNGRQKAFVMGDPATGRGVVLLTNSERGLAIAPAIVEAVFPGAHPAFDWLDYDIFRPAGFVQPRPT